jgi:drug/metabolite transporter (DMT)-like permease
MSATDVPAQGSGHSRAVAPWLTPLELTVLGGIWGSSFLFMRIAANDFGPFALVEIRLALGALVLSPFLWRVRHTLTGKHWLKLALIGAINSAFPFFLFAWGAERAPAGIGAITNAMTVMFTALVAFVLFREPIGIRRALGLVVGLLGVIVLAGDKTSGDSVLLAALAGTTASLAYGVGINLVRHYLSDLAPATIAAGTLLCASVLLAPFAIFTWPAHSVPALSWGSAIALGVMCTGLALLFYYRLIFRIGAARASTVTYLIPLFGVIWSLMFLNEPITIKMIIAGGLILGGVALSQQPAKKK